MELKEVLIEILDRFGKSVSKSVNATIAGNKVVIPRPEGAEPIILGNNYFIVVPTLGKYKVSGFVFNAKNDDKDAFMEFKITSIP